jgi:hypothetical protein
MWPVAPGTDAGWVDVMFETLGAVRAELRAAAGSDDAVAQFATTLALVVVSGSTLAVAQVGDGAVVARRGDAVESVGPVDRSEYLNETTFLTSAAWVSATRVDVGASDGVTGVAAMSDGLQLLALDLASGQPHPPFFAPLYDFAATDDATPQRLAGFLASDRVCARTDDDKTLVLAVRQ